MPKVFFLCNGKKVEVEAISLTGAEIKAEAKKVDEALNTLHDLILQAEGAGEDRQIGDDERVELTHGHSDGGPKHFFTRPPTNFGSAA